MYRRILILGEKRNDREMTHTSHRMKWYLIITSYKWYKVL